jgi:hypothetical protein
MMMAREPTTFDLVVEGKADDPLSVAPSALTLTRLACPPPDVVVMPGGLMLIKVGRYLSAGNRYRYRVASVARLINGRLENGGGNGA